MPAGAWPLGLDQKHDLGVRAAGEHENGSVHLPFRSVGITIERVRHQSEQGRLTRGVLGGGEPLAQVSDLGKPRLRCQSGRGAPGMSRNVMPGFDGAQWMLPSNTWLNLMASASLVPGPP